MTITKEAAKQEIVNNFKQQLAELVAAIDVNDQSHIYQFGNGICLAFNLETKSCVACGPHQATATEDEGLIFRNGHNEHAMFYSRQLAIADEITKLAGFIRQAIAA